MSELGPEVVKVDEFTGHEEALELDPARLAPGSPMPQQFVRNLYTDDTGRFFGGIWRSGTGSGHVSYTENELCVLTEGRVRISDDHGRSWNRRARRLLRHAGRFPRTLGSARARPQVPYAIYEPPPAGRATR